jgi:hypothetical protein
MERRGNPVWLFILFGLALSTLGWALKLGSFRGANACIVVGTGLVLLFGTLALGKMTQGLGPSLRGPLAIIAAGLLVFLLATSNWLAATTMGWALVGSILTLAGTAWLLARLLRALNRPADGQ